MLNRFNDNKLAILFVSIGIISGSAGVYQIASAKLSQPSEEIKITTAFSDPQIASSSPQLAPSISPSIQVSTNSIKVDISGEVSNPGVYELPSGARISDALLAVDGLSSQADLGWIAKNINMATVLKDSDKIYIPSLIEVKKEIKVTASVNPELPTEVIPQVAGITTGNPGMQASNHSPSPKINVTTSPASTSKISINHASAKELEELNGVGPVTAKKIIDLRPYSVLEELKEKKAVGKATYEKIKSSITL
ncbi:MAG: helix-hairpin-helix domain-containing protein [bacterium]|nr:helix-hairpin-helix domain-containing protein [bacterium]